MTAPRPEDFAAFQRKMRMRRNFFGLVAATVGLIPLVFGIVRLTMWALSGNRSGTPTAGIEVDIDGDGRATVRGCADDFETCVRAAAEREDSRPGGARHRAAIHTALGTSQEAIHDVRRTLLENHFVPANPLVRRFP